MKKNYRIGRSYLPTLKLRVTKSEGLLFLLIFPFVFIGNSSFAQVSEPPANPNFFPIGVWLQQTRHAKEYKNAGVNMYVGLWDGLDQAQLTDLKNAGLKVMCDQNTFALSKLSDTTIYAWTLGDEPDNAQWNETTKKYDPCIDPSVIINQYNDIKAKDANRPVYLNLGQGVSNIDWVGRGTCTSKTNMYPVYNNGYAKGCDIISFDIYPVNNTDVTKEKLWYVPKGIDSLNKWVKKKKPVWCWIEVTKIDNQTSNRKPTTIEVKAEVWMALIHGASGFGYFCHSWQPTLDDAAPLNDAVMLAAMTKINKEITSLAPVLNSTSTSYANVSSSNTAVPIDIMTKDYANVNYIFAVGMRPGTTTATFTVNMGTKVEVIGENRSLTISGGKFTDDFTSYAVHLYKVTTDISGINANAGLHNIKIYPNPASENLLVEFTYPLKNVRYEIFDVVGRSVIKGNLVGTSISVAELAKGSYFILLNDALGNQEVHQLLKE